MVEAAFFALAAADVERLTAYADIPESSYVELWHCPSLGALRRLAVLLGCDPSRSFVAVRDFPQKRAAILRAGSEFELALANRTTDELSRAGAAWAHESSWRELDTNPMDLAGDLLFLGAQWVLASERGEPLWVWVDPLA
jgi:hypothetical protein